MTEPPDWARRGRSGWRWVGRERPPFARVPGPDEESVWDYPRPPRIEEDAREVVVRVEDVVIAASRRSLRVLETASPPTFYLPADEVLPDVLQPASGSSRCEWKGEACYWSVIAVGRRVSRAAWSYPRPFSEFERIRDAIAFHPARVDCSVGGLPVEPQRGGFYAGWITPEIVGPFKGEPGSESW